VHAGIGGTGVVGVLRGRRRSNRAIGIRADMDALPIEEESAAAHRSQVPGVMHACGHDGHTATLLASAWHLARTRDFAGTINFIFQPAEEGLGGGLAMLEDGLFERFPCGRIYAYHNFPGLEQGHFYLRDGKMMAGGPDQDHPGSHRNENDPESRGAARRTGRSAARRHWRLLRRHASWCTSGTTR
jgi:hippurate hydrolase